MMIPCAYDLAWLRECPRVVTVPVQRRFAAEDLVRQERLISMFLRFGFVRVEWHEKSPGWTVVTRTIHLTQNGLDMLAAAREAGL